MRRSERDAIPVIEQGLPDVWSQLGDSYEQEVVAALRREAGVRLLVPPASEDDLGEATSLAFLRGTTGATHAHQLLLWGTKTLAARLALQGRDMSFGRGRVDLVRVSVTEEGKREFTLIDIKSTHEALTFHKTQVAWYAILMRALLDECEIDGEIAPAGEIWHRSVDPSALYAVSPFALRAYQGVVKDWALRDLPQALDRTVRPDRDDTDFHVYFKCEQCKYLAHCRRSVEEADPEKLDLSAIPGMSHITKATLHRVGLRTVAAFHAQGDVIGTRDDLDWRLRTRRETLLARAAALVNGTVALVPDHVTLRMPPRADVKVILVADHNPMASRLATIGALAARDGTELVRAVRTIANLDDERAALRDVLGKVREVLHATHEANASGRVEILHIYVYEPAESKDLANALGRHLDDPALLADLLDLVRIFPPDQAMPEPEYRGFHQLPACALRTVIQEVLALPLRVSYDLARVGQALSCASVGGLAAPPPYTPGPAFARPFSSRLPLSRCDELARRRALVDQETGADVAARLDAVHALVCWLEALNTTTPEPRRFLRQRKGPFRLHASIHPLMHRSLELLGARSRLQQYADLLGTLHELAQPVERRVQRQRCISDLHWVKHTEGRWDVRIVLRGSADGEADFHPGSTVLLSDGHPDSVLDPQLWGGISGRLERVEGRDGVQEFTVSLPKRAFASPMFGRLRGRPNAGWVLDQGLNSVTEERLQNFLKHLDREESK